MEKKVGFFQNEAGKVSVGKVMKFTSFLVSVLLAVGSLVFNWSEGLGYVIAFLSTATGMEGVQKIADHGMKR
jgi:hypothetical protein